MLSEVVYESVCYRRIKLNGDSCQIVFGGYTIEKKY